MPVRIVKSEDAKCVPIRQTNHPHLMDEEDEVVQEIDVFLSPTLAGQIHLLQFPLTQLPPTKPSGGGLSTTTSHTTIHSITPSEARIKSLHGKLELDVPLPSNMERDGGYSFVDDLRTFHSQTIPIQTHLCLAKMLPSHNGGTSELHLVPLTDIKQMRPSFQHVDAEDQANNAVEDNRDMETDATIGAGHKPVVFQRKESERAAHARKSSYAYKKASEDSEEWTALAVCLPRSSEYKQVIKSALCDDKHQQVLSSATSQSTYIQSLHYLPEGAGASKNAVDDFDGHDLKSIVARLSTQMQGGGPIPWVVLRANFDVDAVLDAQLLQALTVVSVLVRGNFCVHSKFLVSLPPAAARARTFLLLLLHLHGCLHRPRLDRVFGRPTTNATTTAGLSSDQLLSILQTLAQKTPQQGWTLRLPDDEVFVRHHPAQVRKHNEYWKRQEQRFRHDLTLYNAIPEA